MTQARNTILVFLLALTMTLSSLMTHAAGAAPAGLTSGEMASVHTASMCGLPSGMSGDGCAAMAGHCLITSCDPYTLSQPSAIRFDVSHPALHIKSYRIFATIEIPPPRTLQ
ncbi:hypothetical protein [Sulfitobacter sp. M13]